MHTASIEHDFMCVDTCLTVRHIRSVSVSTVVLISTSL
jgi:hypothetical protein